MQRATLFSGLWIININVLHKKIVVMKFSVILPIYKVEKYLHECVDSILNQTFTDFEVILVDDGSPDPVHRFVMNTPNSILTSA